MALCIPCTIAPFGGASLCVGGACSRGANDGFFELACGHNVAVVDLPRK